MVFPDCLALNAEPRDPAADPAAGRLGDDFTVRQCLIKHFVLRFGKLVECGLNEVTLEVFHLFVPVLNGGVLWSLLLRLLFW